jgi:ATP-dependent DNA helicase DinG
VPRGSLWQELGLSRFCSIVEGHSVVFDQGVPVPDQDSEDAGGLLCVVYPSSERAESLGEALDLRLLARVLHPTLSDHRLEAVCAHHGIQIGGDRPGAAGALFGALIEEAIELDRELIALLTRLLPPSWADLLGRILLIPRPERAAGERIEVQGQITDDDRIRSDAADVLGAQGAIAGALPAYEERSGQLKMAEMVQEVFREGEALLVEAGPGTGKTFAYLVPAILHLMASSAARVVVSTRTKQLQEQLYGKDLPFLLTHLAPGLKVALLKGRENYICLRRWQALVTEMSGSLERDRLVLLAPLARWLFESETGDVDENGAFLADPEGRLLWGRLCDVPNHCIGIFCPFLDSCFSIAARRRARKADLVVVNHSLLLGDLAVGGAVLGRYSHLVVDEAHSLEAVARTAFTRSLSERIVARVADELAPSTRRMGWLHRLSLPPTNADVKQAREHVATVRRRTATLFRSLGRKLPDERRGTFSSLSGLEPRIVETTTALEQLEMALDRLGERLDGQETLKELEGHNDRVSGLADVAKEITAVPDENTVHWYERDPGGLTLHATPLDVAPFFQRLLYPRVESLVLTSATLSLAGDFDYIIRSIGLTDSVLRVRTALVESPFSFRDRMKVAVPAYFPPIDGEADAYVEALASLLAMLAAKLGKKGLALFTSYRMLRAVRDRIPSDIAAFAQGVDGPRSKLIDRFRAHPGAGVLLGTESFWEGVDFPGDEMEYLVITRLPFSVPTDPILSALADRIAREGRDAFRDLSLPQAILKLRQGIGRLIRTRDDHGIVVLTDQRVLSRSYGRRFIEALPVPADTYGSEDDLVAEVADWFARGR